MVRSLFSAAACSVALVDDVGESLVFVAASGAGAAEIIGVSMPVGRGIAGWAASSGQSVAVRDVQRDPRFARDVAEPTGYLPEAIFAAPLVDPDGEVLGVMSVLDPDVEEATDRTLAILGTFSAVTALLVPEPGAPQASEALDGSDLTQIGEAVVRLVSTWPHSRPPAAERPGRPGRPDPMGSDT